MWRFTLLGLAEAALLLLMGYDLAASRDSDARAGRAAHDGPTFGVEGAKDTAGTVTAVAAAGPGALTPTSPAPPRAPAPGDEQHERGRAVYNFRCYFCHGYSGDAKTLASTYLAPRPRDFTAAALSAAKIEAAVRRGKPGTAMQPFTGVLAEAEIRDVAAFVEREFVRDKSPNTAYHTPQNGWPGHERHAAAFPFARGEIALDTPAEQLTQAQQDARALFLTSCVSCHDRARVQDEGPAWAPRPVSYPRMGFVPGQPNVPPAIDAISGASVYARQERPPQVANLTAQQRRGERLFQDNCAFCHGGSGTGRNWIGQFMEPKARDLTQYTQATMPRLLLRQRIREGLADTSMPAWKDVLAPAEIEAVAVYVERTMFRDGAAGASARVAADAAADGARPPAASR